MWDRTVTNINLAMRRDTLEQLPENLLPPGYTLRLYQPGDEHHWARIERSAEEFTTEAAALAAFQKDFGKHPEALPERMLFLLDAEGLPVGTAAAWFGRPIASQALDFGAAVQQCPRPSVSLAVGPHENKGHLHWVGIAQEHQGKGLCKPLVTAALRLLRELGHQDAFLTTQTPSWVAIRVYLQSGFRPASGECEEEQEGWAIVREKLPDMEIPNPTE